MYVLFIAWPAKACGLCGAKLDSDLYMVAFLPLVCAVNLVPFPLPCPKSQYLTQLDPTSIASLVSTNHVHCLRSLVTLY
jgi:hypothetical protein